jgi:hypothetical protein
MENTILKSFIIFFLILSLINGIYGYSLYNELLNSTPLNTCLNPPSLNSLKLISILSLSLSAFLLFVLILYIGIDMVRFRGEYENPYVYRGLFTTILLVNMIVSTLSLLQIEPINLCYGDGINTIQPFYMVNAINLGLSSVGFIGFLIYMFKKPIQAPPKKEEPKKKTKEEEEFEEDIARERIRQTKVLLEEELRAKDAAAAARKTLEEQTRQGKIKEGLLKDVPLVEKEKAIKALLEKSEKEKEQQKGVIPPKAGFFNL